jgi:hypothetical protein
MRKCPVCCNAVPVENLRAHTMACVDEYLVAEVQVVEAADASAAAMEVHDHVVSQFEGLSLTDDCYINWPLFVRFQRTPFFLILVLAMLGAGMTLRMFSYDWDWPPNFAWLRASTPLQANLCYTGAGLLCGGANLLLMTAHNKTLANLVHRCFDFYFLTGNFLCLGTLEAYDTATSTSIHWLPVLIMTVTYMTACENVFGVDALSVQRGGSRVVKVLFFVAVLLFFSCEMLLWRWMRRSRDTKISLPFFEGSLGAIASTLAANQLLFSVKLIMAGMFSQNNVFVVKAGLQLVPVLPPGDESFDKSRVTKGGAESPVHREILQVNPVGPTMESEEM